MEIHVKNQLNDNLTIEFCCGEKEYTLQHDEGVVIEISEDVCMYFDIVRDAARTETIPTLYDTAEKMCDFLNYQGSDGSDGAVRVYPQEKLKELYENLRTAVLKAEGK